MTTFATANPLDYARADFSTFTVPHPVRAAAVDSIIKEERSKTPLSAINERKQPRLTVSELNDMDMDEIKQRFYNTGIDTRGPVTKFLDIIDLPRNVLFNIAASDTAKRKANMGDTAAFGLGRVNTSDVLESLGVRPGLATGILGFVGDVALDPLTYIGPAGWGAKAASAGGKTVSYTRAGTKALREAVDAVKAGRTASSPAVAKYLETLGHTAESIAANPDKIKLAGDIERTLLGGKRTRFNKVMGVFGEDAERAAIDNARSLADDITDYTNFKGDIVAKDAATNARVAAAKDVYKETGRPFSKGVRIYRDKTKPLGIGMTTSRDMAHGSGLLHIPFTDTMLSVPAFTPFANQQGLIASLVKSGNSNFDESKYVNGLKPSIEGLDERWFNYQQEREAYDALNASTAAGVDDVALTPEEAHREFLDYAYGLQQPDGTRTGGAVTQMAKTLEEMQADPMTSYADMLHAQDVFKAYAGKAQIAREEWLRAKNAMLETDAFSAAVDSDVEKLVNTDIEGLRGAQRAENMHRESVKGKIPTTIDEIVNERNAENAIVSEKNPAKFDEKAVKFDQINANLTGTSKNKMANNSDPAFFDTATPEWKELRYTPPGDERIAKARLALGDSKPVDTTAYDEFGMAVDGTESFDEVAKSDLEILDELARKDSDAFTGLNIGLKLNGKFKVPGEGLRYARIDLSKVEPGDVWWMGNNKVEVVDVDPFTGYVTVKVDMESGVTTVSSTVTKESSKRKAYAPKTQRTTRDRLVETFEEPRYYTLNPTTDAFANKANKNSPFVTVERKVKKPVKGNILYHGSPADFDEFDTSLSGGGVSLTDRRATATNYAAGSGGGRAVNDIVAINADGVAYHKVGDEWVAFGRQTDTEGTIGPLDGDFPSLSQSQAEDLQRQGVLNTSAANSNVYSVDIGDSKILDLTTPEGQAIFAGLAKTGNSRTDQIIENGFRWNDTKFAKQTGSLQPIYDQLRNMGYDGIKHADDGPYTTTNIFNKDKLKIVDKQKVFSTPGAPPSTFGVEIEPFAREQLPKYKLEELAYQRLGITADDIAEARLGDKTEYAGLDEKAIRERLVAKRLDEQRAKMNAREDGAVPLYLDKAERVDRSAYADYLHAKADAAQTVADASLSPYLATVGSDVKAAVEAVRDAFNLGADDLGSGIMQSLVSATTKYSPTNKYGQKMIHEAQGLERFFVNNMGLPPGIANDMVKQAVKAANVADSQAFKTAVADITRTLTDSGITPAELSNANDLAMAFLFAGDTPIEELIARGDIAGEMIQKAMQSGILQDPNKASAIRGVAEKYRAIFAKLDDGTGIANYAPNVLTPQAKNIIDYQRRNRMNIIGARARGDNLPVSPAEKMTESFEKKRSTIEHVWMGPENKPIRMMESELAYLAYSPADLQAIAARDPEQYRYLASRIEHAKLYSQLTEADKLTRVKSYYLSPMEINRRVRDNGMFNTLTNNALNGNDFMHSNFTAAVAARLGSQERKYANQLLQQYVAPHALRLNEIELAQAGEATGRAIDMKTVQGTPVTLVNEGGKKTIYLGNKKYKQPTIDVSNEFSPLKDLFTTPSGKPIANEFYPEEIADIINDTAGFFSDRATGGMAKAFGEADAASRMTSILKGADTLSGYWKVFTLLHPSWTINDIIGNLFFMANMGIHPDLAIKNAKEAWKMTRAQAAGDREVLREMTVKGRSAADHFDDAFGQVVNSHQAADATMHLRQSGETIEPFNTSIGSTLGKAVRGDFAGAKAEARQMVDESWQAAGKTIDNQNVDRPFATQEGKAVKQPINALFQQGLIRRVWQPWAHLNGMANDWLKTTAYLSLLDQGYDAASAARMISEKMLDMSVLTSTDRSVRRFVPFYNWMKNSGVLGVREMLRNPKFFSIAPKVKQALEESFNGEQNLPENARPSWIRDQLALQIGTDPDTRRALTLTSSLPTEAATYALSFLFSPFMGAGALQDSLAYGINSITPAVKIPLELGSRREFFTKRTIDGQGGDITPSEYLIQQVRPLRELGIGSLRGGPLQRAFSDSPVMGVSRALVGGRLQPFDEERRVSNLQREYDDRVDALRRRIGISEREGQKEESLRRRVELLQLFNQMQKLSLTIPKWATGQIAGINAEPVAN